MRHQAMAPEEHLHVSSAEKREPVKLAPRVYLQRPPREALSLRTAAARQTLPQTEHALPRTVYQRINNFEGTLVLFN